jgi:hypothetical protein
MAAGHDVRFDSEAFECDLALEIQWKEPVRLAGQYAGGDSGPVREIA